MARDAELGVVSVEVVIEAACSFRAPWVHCLLWEAGPDLPPCSKAGSLPLGSHSFPIAVCGRCLPHPLEGELLESRDHLHLCTPRTQHRSWHRGGIGGRLVIGARSDSQWSGRRNELPAQRL